jgi:hypothetical protein
MSRFDNDSYTFQNLMNGQARQAVAVAVVCYGADPLDDDFKDLINYLMGVTDERPEGRKILARQFFE